MSKGLEALERLVDGNLNEVNYYRQFCDSTTYIMKDKEIIEKELKEKETQDDYIKMLEDRIDNLETTYLRNKKALEIIKEKKVNIKLFLLSGDDDYELYNMFYGYEDLTQEEYDLLNEVLR